MICREFILLPYSVTLYRFFVKGIGVFVVHFRSKLVCECECRIRICSGSISFHIYILFSQLNTTPIFQGEQHKVGLQVQSVTLFPIFFHSTILYVLSFLPTKNTFHCIYIIPNTFLCILENTNQTKVKESDHAVTQKVTQPFLLLAFSQSFEGKRVSYSSYGKICNLCLPVYERLLG